MVLARVADFFSPNDSKAQFVDDGRRDGALTMETLGTVQDAMEEKGVDLDAARPPYIHVRIAHSVVEHQRIRAVIC
jgi:hypothetical protein